MQFHSCGQKCGQPVDNHSTSSINWNVLQCMNAFVVGSRKEGLPRFSSKENCHFLLLAEV